MKRAVGSQEIAEAAVFLASDEARSINGHTIVIDGGSLTRGYPALLTGAKSGATITGAGRQTTGRGRCESMTPAGDGRSAVVARELADDSSLTPRGASLLTRTISGARGVVLGSAARRVGHPAGGRWPYPGDRECDPQRGSLPARALDGDRSSECLYAVLEAEQAGAEGEFRAAAPVVADFDSAGRNGQRVWYRR